MKRPLAIGLLVALAGSGCTCKRGGYDSTEIRELPKTPLGLPEVVDPTSNPTTVPKVVLGRLLFFDERLSKNDYMACVDCHLPDHGWAASTAGSLNVAGKRTRRKSPGVANSGYHAMLTWDGRAKTIEDVAMIAWKNQLSADPPEIAKKLAGIEGYPALFQKAFGAQPSADNVLLALGAFLRALKSGNAPYDRFRAGDANAISEPAKRGAKLFESLGCVRCHSGPLFTDGQFHNVGVGASKSGELADLGRAEPTKNPADTGKFRTPSLRDSARSGPWFHDGSAEKLSDAISVMASGGFANANLDPALTPRTPQQNEVADLEAFLESLNGEVTMGPPPELPSHPKKK